MNQSSSLIIWRPHIIALSGACCLAALIGAPRPADACSPELQCPVTRYPLEAATGVPTNTKIWTKHNGDISLVKVVNPEEPFQAPLEPIVTLPDALEPNTQYQVFLQPPEGDTSCGDEVSLMFTTGSGPDAVPGSPALDEATATFVAEGVGNACGPFENHFEVSLSLLTPLIADAVAHRVYQVDGARTLVVETMLPAMPRFDIAGTSVDNHYVVVAVSASNLESGDTAFAIEEGTPGVDGSADDSGCNAANHNLGSGGGLIAFLMNGAVATWLARRRS